MNTITPITPITKINSLEDLQKLSGSSTQDPSQVQIPFQSVFQDAVNNVNQTQSNLDSETYKMTTGQSDNLHDIAIASKKASLSVDLLVQLRNKVLDAYNEVMRMSV